MCLRLYVASVIPQVDLPTAQVDRVVDEMVSCFDVHPDEIIMVSAKTGASLFIIFLGGVLLSPQQKHSFTAHFYIAASCYPPPPPPHTHTHQ